MYTEAQKKTLEMISKIGIIPVIAIDDAAKAVPLARALVAGGLPAAEVTFRTAAAEDAIKAIAAEVPEMLLGAGTVITDEQADRALAAGCTFLVSPGFIPELTQAVTITEGVTYEVSGNKSQILRCKSPEDMQSVGEADVNVFGNAMIIRIPLKALGLSEHNYQVEFKVTDNVQNMIGDPLNLYSTGDAAPIGSLNFSFGY